MFLSQSDDSISILYADRSPCPVCGNLTGDCKGDSTYHGSIQIAPKPAKDPSATFRVPKRIYTEEVVNGRKIRKLLYPKGAAITAEEAKRLGLIP